MKLPEIVNELKKCGYHDNIGPLENHPAFIELENMAKAIEEEEQREKYFEELERKLSVLGKINVVHKQKANIFHANIPYLVIQTDGQAKFHTVQGTGTSREAAIEDLFEMIKSSKDICLKINFKSKFYYYCHESEEFIPKSE